MFCGNSSEPCILKGSCSQAPLLAGLLLCVGAAVGNVATHTTFNHTALAPQVISFTYDALSRLKPPSSPGPRPSSTTAPIG
jgi:hypothetical protein